MTKTATRCETDELPVEKVWERFLETRDLELRNQLVVYYAGLVHTHAARLSRKLPSQISYDEICSAAFDGLIEAVEAYDPERKAKFETFCQQRISGAVMDWLRTLDPPESHRTDLRKNAACRSRRPWGSSPSRRPRRRRSPGG